MSSSSIIQPVRHHARDLGRLSRTAAEVRPTRVHREIIGAKDVMVIDRLEAGALVRLVLDRVDEERQLSGGGDRLIALLAALDRDGGVLGTLDVRGCVIDHALQRVRQRGQLGEAASQGGKVTQAFGGRGYLSARTAARGTNRGKVIIR